MRGGTADATAREPRRHEDEFPGAGTLRSALRWLDERRGYQLGVEALRQLLPGDSRFGDPLSTTGSDPVHIVARRAWSAERGRLSAVRELGLAALQVAEWLSPATRRQAGSLAIAFTDLVGFSTWALRAGDDRSLELLRSADAAVTASVDDHGGAVVKRLGDGTMAVFDHAADAVGACEEAIDAISAMRVEDYVGDLRAGVHVGTPHPIGEDFIGVDVNIAARLCEVASAREIVLSASAREQLDAAASTIERRTGRALRGVPPEMEIYVLHPRGRRDARAHRSPDPAAS